MARAASLDDARGMESPRRRAAANARPETVGRLDGADGIVVGASELAAFERELERLRASRARDLPARLRRARGFVAADAVEEIAHIHEDHAVIDARIARLEELLRTATVLSDGPADGVATLGCVVEVEYERTGRRASHRLSGVASGADAGSVSARSPVGRALMGRRSGEVVSVELPSGRIESLRIVAIAAPPVAEAA
jgi:transcription elongation factor GreA